MKIKSTTELNDTIHKVEQICKSNKLGLTQIRRQVFEIIIKNNKPIKAYEILDKISNLNNKLSHPPTVYRAIDFLIENGFVHKLNSINSYVGCFHPKAHKECYFLICKKCNIYQECCDDSLKDRISKTAVHNNFVISNTSLEIEGHCLDCNPK